jgi:hypothetical protein
VKLFVLIGLAVCQRFPGRLSASPDLSAVGGTRDLVRFIVHLASSRLRGRSGAASRRIIGAKIQLRLVGAGTIRSGLALPPPRGIKKIC